MAKGRNRIYGTTIQTWPGGQSYEYRGDPDGPAEQKRLRAGHYSPWLRCPEHCRERGVQTLTPEQYERYIAEKTAGGTISPVTSPDLVTVGRYVSTEGDDWTGNRVCVTCAGAGYLKNPKRNPWRKGTAAEWRAIRIELRAEMYWRRDGQGCDSALVDDLLKAANDIGGDLGEGFGYDEIRNLYADPSDWDYTRLQEYAEDEGLELPDLPTCACENPTKIVLKGSADPSCAACGAEWPNPDDDGVWLADAQEVCRDHAQDHPAEVYEWWRVSSWLCDQLHAIGEVTIDNGYGHWWGRTCTGQSLLMDGTLQKIAARHERGEG